MNRELIEQLAREADLETMWELTPNFVRRLEAFARLVAAHQREVDAKICDARYLDYIEPEMKEIAAAIRKGE